MKKSASGVELPLDSPDLTFFYDLALSYSLMQNFVIESGKYNLNAPDRDGNTALMLAALRGDQLPFKRLLKANVNLYVRNKADDHILDCIAKGQLNNKTEMIRLLVERIKKECPGDEKKFIEKLRNLEFSMHQAITLKDPELTKMLLRNGYQLNYGDPHCNRSPLHEAVILNDLGNVRVLLDHNADVNFQDINSQTPLHVFDPTTETEDKLTILKLLLARGARNVPDNMGVTPFHKLFSQGTKAMIAALLRYEVDLYEANRQRLTPLHIMAANPNPDVFEAIRGRRINVNARDNAKEETALFMAVKNRHVEKVRFLLENGANPNYPDRDDRGVLYFALSVDQALRQDDLQIIHLLLEYDVNVQYLHDSRKFSVFDICRVGYQNKFSLLKPVLAHIAMLDVYGEFIQSEIQEGIESKSLYMRRYNDFRQQAQDMAEVYLNANTTLRNLLTEPRDRMVIYARNEPLVLALEGALRLTTNAMDEYYRYRLRSRIDHGFETLALMQIAASALCRLIGIPPSFNHVFDGLVRALSFRDLQNLDYALGREDDFVPAE